MRSDRSSHFAVCQLEVMVYNFWDPVQNSSYQNLILPHKLVLDLKHAMRIIMRSLVTKFFSPASPVNMVYFKPASFVWREESGHFRSWKDLKTIILFNFQNKVRFVHTLAFVWSSAFDQNYYSCKIRSYNSEVERFRLDIHTGWVHNTIIVSKRLV